MTIPPAQVRWTIKKPGEDTLAGFLNFECVKDNA